jgi:hypothetical protein
MMASVSGVASTASLPGRAWSAWPCVTTARAAGRTGPYRGHAGMRQYFDDVQRVWRELTIEADDYRVVPGSVVVMGHVSGMSGDTAIRRRAMWTWRLRDARAVMVRVTDLGDAT